MNNEIIRYTLVLGLITILSATIIAYSHNLTKKPIDRELRKDFLAGLYCVLPEFDNEPDIDAVKIDNITVYVAKKEGAIVGYAVEATSKKGYSGEIAVIVGTKPNAVIYGITVVRHTETPGIGDKIEKVSFTSLFSGKSLNKKYAIRNDGGDIDSLSGATISSRAVCDAVNKANKLLLEVIREAE